MMSPQTSFRITDKETGDESTLTADFTSEEWDTLEDYLEYLGELQETALMQAGVPIALEMRGDRSGVVQISTELPPWDDVIVFLHRLRPFILHNEHSSFNRVRGILGKKLRENEHIRGFLKRAGRLYDGTTLRSSVSIALDDELVNSERVLFAWLNSYEYHRDEDKKAIVDGLCEMLPLEFSQAVFLLMLREKAHAILDLAKLVRLALGQKLHAEFEA